MLENLRNITLTDMAQKSEKCAEFILFFLKGFLNTERRNNAPSFTAGQETICFFFYFFLKLTF